MSEELDRLKSSWADYKPYFEHLIIASIQAEKLRALNVIYRLEEVKLGIVGVGGLTAPSFTMEDFSDLKNWAKKTVQSIRRIIFATGAKGVGPLEDLPFEQARNINTIRYTYKRLQLKQLGLAAQQAAQADGDQVNTYSSLNQYTDTTDAEAVFDGLHQGDVIDSDRKNVDDKLELVPRTEKSELSSPIGEKALIFNHWVPGTDSISTTDPEVQKNKWTRSESYNLAQGIQDLQDGGNTGLFTFKIKNLATGIEELFPAYIRNFVENITPSWNAMSFINRSEDIAVYQKTDRTFNMEFYLFATQAESNQQETPEQYTVYTTNGAATLDVIGKDDLWRKTNFMHSITRPTYGEDGTYLKAPYCRLWIGNLIQGLVFIADGITINYEPLIWDLNGADVKPMINVVTLSGRFLHEEVPSAYTDFYGNFSEPIEATEGES
jgi:hypothetical protein